MAVILTRLRNLILLVLSVVVFIVLIGATYQGVATALERRQFPRPGGLVGVADHQLHIYCQGEGAPAVILEAPAAGVSAAWGEVQSRVARSTRTCSYDRAGLGWSESSDRPYDPGRVPEELRALLEGAGETGPFVVVGHGLGAAFARMYAARPDSNAAALILIDPPAAGDDDPATMRVMNVSPWLARAGVLRAGRILSSKAEPLNDRAGGALRTFLNRPDHLSRASRELAEWDLTVRMAAGATVRSDLPTTIVEASGPDRVAFLTDSFEIAKAVAAIEDAVRLVRRGK